MKIRLGTMNFVHHSVTSPGAMESTFCNLFLVTLGIGDHFLFSSNILCDLYFIMHIPLGCKIFQRSDHILLLFLNHLPVFGMLSYI